MDYGDGEPEAGKPEAKVEDESKPERSKRKLMMLDESEQKLIINYRRQKTERNKTENEISEPESESDSEEEYSDEVRKSMELQPLGDGHYLEGPVIYYFGKRVPDKDLIKEKFKDRPVIYSYTRHMPPSDELSTSEKMQEYKIAIEKLKKNVEISRRSIKSSPEE